MQSFVQKILNEIDIKQLDVPIAIYEQLKEIVTLFGVIVAETDKATTGTDNTDLITSIKQVVQESVQEELKNFIFSKMKEQ